MKHFVVQEDAAVIPFFINANAIILIRTVRPERQFSNTNIHARENLSEPCWNDINLLNCSPCLFPWICWLSVLMIGLSLRVSFCLLSATLTQRWKMKWRLWLMQLLCCWLKERPNYHRPDWALSGLRPCHALIKVLQRCVCSGVVRCVHVCMCVCVLDSR